MRRAVCALLLGFATLASGQPVKVESVTWLVSNVHGTARPIDGMLAYLGQRWPEVKQEELTANAKRSWQLIAAGEHACHTSAVRTPEREQLAYFTNTVLMAPSQVIVKRDLYKRLPLNAAGEVDLARLMADKRLSGAYVEGRSYGPVIDALIAQRPAGKSGGAFGYPSADFGSRILPMLGRGRADYAIEYEAAMALQVGNGVDMKLLRSVPIQGASEPVLAGIACPRTPWGLAAITTIDRLLGNPEAAAMLRQQFGTRMSEDSLRHYGARIDAFTQLRSKPSREYATPGTR
ncbi:hypothetical protein J7U46_15235 [Pelomonas sp. V22]|uniref:hypothetical protein n=1 Tax=Pelomonas sp. V22 TaxID=2822139 RepID=UPI0024A85805|nr:hypothetical protein [Pelomonas sp. V22]MDI4634411.1 hypothetical protein [Pelomonas sp. V22]